MVRPACRHVRKGAFSTMRLPGKFRWSGSFVLPTIDRTGHATKGTGSCEGLPNPLPEAERGRKTAAAPLQGGGATSGCSPSAPPLRFGEGAGGRGSASTVQGRMRRLLLSWREGVLQ